MLLRDFAEWMEFNRGYARNSIENYVRCLKLFNNYLRSISLCQKDIEDPEGITMYHVESYIKDERKYKDKEPGTCNGYLAAIRLYLKYCFIRGLNVLNRKKILYIKEVKADIGFLNEDEVKKIKTYIKNTDETDIIKVRNQLIVQMFLRTGLRVSELCNIRVEELGESITVTGKGGTTRIVYLLPEIMDLINLYLFMRDGKHIKSEWLFISHSPNYLGHKLTRVSVEKIIKQIGSECGIDKKVHPHLLRHTFATQLLRRGGNLYYIQKLLGHKNITTTQGYLGCVNLDLKNTQELLD